MSIAVVVIGECGGGERRNPDAGAEFRRLQIGPCAILALIVRTSHFHLPRYSAECENPSLRCIPPRLCCRRLRRNYPRHSYCHHAANGGCEYRSTVTL